MKKDGIQTRNRKLSAKSKKKRGSVVDFFSPFDAKSFSYGGMSGMTALTGMGGSGGGGSTGKPDQYDVVARTLGKPISKTLWQPC